MLLENMSSCVNLSCLYFVYRTMEAYAGTGGRQRLDALLRGLAATEEQNILLEHLPAPAQEILSSNDPIDIRFLNAFHGSCSWWRIKEEAFRYFTEVASIAPTCNHLGHAHLSCPVDCIQLGEVNKALGSYTLRLVKCPIPSHPRRMCIIPVVIYRSLNNNRYLGRVTYDTADQATASRLTTTWPRPLTQCIFPGVPMGGPNCAATSEANTRPADDIPSHYVYADDTFCRPPNGREDMITLRQFYINNLVKLLD